MALCRIYDSSGKEIASISTADPKWGASLSVGTSPLCSVCLDKTSDENSGKTFFSLLKRDGSWWLTVSSPDCVVLLENEIIQEAELGDGMKIEFDDFHMTVQIDQQQSPYELVLEYPSGKTESFKLFWGVNTVGNSSDNNINISDKSCSRRQAFISVDRKGFYILNHDSTSSGTYMKGSKIIGRTDIKLNEEFVIGDVRVWLVEKEKDRGLSAVFSTMDEERRKWYFATLFCMSLIFILAMMIIWKKQNPLDSGGRIELRKKSILALPFNSKTLNQKIFKLVKEGKTKFAIDLLDNSIRKEKQKKDFSEFRDALVKEKSAVSDLRYYRAKLKTYSFDRIEDAFIKFLKKRQEEKDRVLRSHRFWDNVLARFTELEKEDMNPSNKYAAEVWKYSYFRARLPSMKKQLSSLISTYSFLEKINKMWDSGEWGGIMEELKNPQNVKLVKAGNMKMFCRKLGVVAMFGFYLQEKKEEFSNQKFSTVNIEKFKKDCKEMAEMLKNLETNTFCPSECFEQSFAKFKNFVNVTARVHKLYLLWEKTPSDIKTTKELADALDAMRMIHEQPEIFIDTYKTVEETMFKYIQNYIKKIKPSEDRKGLKQLDEILKYSSIIYDTAEGDRYEKIIRLRRDIVRKINKRCDDLYYEYNRYREKGEYEKSVAVLKKIISTASQDNRYCSWAEKELKRLKRSSSSPR